MNKQLSIISMILGAFVGVIMLMAFGSQQGNNGKNDKAQKQEKGNQKANDKVQPGKPVAVQQGQGQNKGNQANKGNQGNSGQGNNNGNNGKGNDNAGNPGKANDKTILNDSRRNDDDNMGRLKLKNLNGNGSNWYSWNDQNFKDRKQYRNKDKVTICHKFNSNEEPVNISVSENALKAHMAHGDVVGNCPAVNNSIFSDIFRKRRADYYNDLYYGQDQYNYSSSILDYALMRLTNSRLQLDQMRANNAAQADIDRRQTAVLGLEQNVSLLETVLGVAGQLLVNRLQ
jgi:hypothetical protein